MKIAITGGSGFIGQKLSQQLADSGHELIILTRTLDNKPAQSHITYVEWLTDGSEPEKHLEGIDAIVNLAGESIMGRWTKEKKQKILDSRVEATREVLSIIQKLKQKPEVLLNASAIGYYGISETADFVEGDEPEHKNFLSEVSITWEQEAKKALEYGVRVVYGRIGIVLDDQAGALPKMIIPYKLFAGGRLGTGRQWFSWVHIDDLTAMYQFALENKSISGPFNITAPNPMQMQEFGHTLAKVMNRPHWLPAPTFALSIVLGEMSTLLVEGQKVYPRKAKDNGYTFKYSELKPALEHLTGS
ncbi:TIGR01777 family oxidoreductase [Alkalicoccobacillus porphyridii]|uniref:TIGR01777 family protein n=1 Tax=Alkalicoccobacillus porphyridii TaxID=2597270 RepID=A0A553ZUN9_9BACI|nr:TIGR01777 family oxidoreductase [Alkalicoccobacillus porphyridii]TSB45201.1 TIGR01777 family protein [Alkalicoccobacillus porphyridii]